MSVSSVWNHGLPPVQQRTLIPSLVDLSVKTLVDSLQNQDAALDTTNIPGHLVETLIKHAVDHHLLTETFLRNLPMKDLRVLDLRPTLSGQERLLSTLPRFDTDTPVLPISTSIIAWVVNSASALKEVHLRSVRLSLVLQQSLAKHDLEVLDMDGCSNCYVEQVLPVIRACRNSLHTIDLRNCPVELEGEINALLTSIFQLCPQARRLDFTGIRCQADEVLPAALKYCPYLQYLSIDLSLSGSYALVQPARSHEHFEHLSAVCSYVSESTLLEAIRWCPRLQTLSLLGCPNVTDLVVQKVAELCTSIKSVDFSEAAITEAAVIGALDQCKHIHTLELSWCEDLSDRALASLFRSLDSLHRVVLKQMDQTSDTTLRLLADHPELEYLDIGRCSEITGPAVAHVAAACHRLKDIRIPWIGVIEDEHIITVLTSCPELTYLGIEGDKLVTTAVFPVIVRSAPQLELLSVAYINGIEMNEIDLLTERLPTLIVLDYYGSAHVHAHAQPSLMRNNDEIAYAAM